MSEVLQYITGQHDGHVFLTRRFAPMIADCSCGEVLVAGGQPDTPGVRWSATTREYALELVHSCFESEAYDWAMPMVHLVGEHGSVTKRPTDGYSILYAARAKRINLRELLRGARGMWDAAPDLDEFGYLKTPWREERNCMVDAMMGLLCYTKADHRPRRPRRSA